MPAYYQKALAGFITENPASVLWKLTQANAVERFPLTPQAIEAWGAQVPVLVTAIAHLTRVFPESQRWSILLEYPIPIVGKRIDAVLLMRNVIIVIETKTGASPTSAARQVDDYALNLACFHEYSAHRIIVPLVVADAPVATNVISTEFDTLIEKCQVSSTSGLGQILETICRQYVTADEPEIDADQWNCGRFRSLLK